MPYIQGAIIKKRGDCPAFLSNHNRFRHNDFFCLGLAVIYPTHPFHLNFQPLTALLCPAAGRNLLPTERTFPRLKDQCRQDKCLIRRLSRGLCIPQLLFTGHHTKGNFSRSTCKIRRFVIDKPLSHVVSFKTPCQFRLLSTSSPR